MSVTGTCRASAGSMPKVGPMALAMLCGVVGDHDETDQTIELDVVEPLPGGSRTHATF